MFLSLLWTGAFGQGVSVEEFNRALTARTAELAAFNGPGSNAETRSASDRFAIASTLTDFAVEANAREVGITCTEDEAVTAILPVLSRNGLVDIGAKKLDVRNDPNVKAWLKDQGSSIEALIQSGRTLVLWAKLAGKDVTVTPDDVKRYLKEHPESHIIPTRVDIELTEFKRPSHARAHERGTDAATSMTVAELLAPGVDYQTRGTTAYAFTWPKNWDRLHMFIDLTAADPQLAAELTGKKVGDTFDEVELSSGALAAGKIKAILPTFDLASSPEYWNWAILMTKLSRADQADTFIRIQSAFLQKNPALRSIFDTVGSAFNGAVNWVNSNVVQPAVTWVSQHPGATVGAVAGGVATAFTGDPQFIMQGYQLGSSLDSLRSGNPGAFVNSLGSVALQNSTLQQYMPQDLPNFAGMQGGAVPTLSQWNFPQMPIQRLIPAVQQWSSWPPQLPPFQQYLSYPNYAFPMPMYVPFGPRMY